MLAGRKAKYGRIRIGLIVDATNDHTGGGVATFGYTAGMESGVIFNSVMTELGIYLGCFGNGDDDSGGWAFSIPGLSISDTTAGSYSTSTNSYLHLVGAKLYQHFSSIWYVVVDSVEWYVDGSLVGTYAGGTITSTGLAPCYVPLTGIPFIVEGSPGPTIQNIPFPSEMAGDASVALALQGVYEIQEVGSSDWHGLPITFATPVLPGPMCESSLTVDGIVGGTTTSSVELNLYVSSGLDIQVFGGEYFQRSRTFEDRGWVCIQPNLDRSVAKLGDSYCSVVTRGGFPYVRSYASRSCGPTDPPSEGGPYPSPYYASEDLFSYMHASLGREDATVRAAHHAIDDPLEETVYAPYAVAKARSQGSWIGLGLFNGDPYDPGAAPSPLDGVYGDSVSFTSHEKVQHPTKYGDPNSDMLGYLSWDDSSATPTQMWNIIGNASYWGSPHWSYIDSPGDYVVDGVSIPWVAYWGQLGTQMSDLGTRTDRISAPLLDNGNLGFMENFVFGVRSSWRGISSFQLDKPALPASFMAEPGDRWTLTDCTAIWNPTTFALASDGPANIVAEYSLADWNEAPYLYTQFVQSFVLDWSATNVAGLSVYLVGRDGTKVLLTDEPGEFLWPAEGLTAKKYAGTWRQDWGVGAVSATGVDLKSSGQSLAAMNDPKRVIASQLLPSRSAAKIRFEVEVVDTGDPVVIDLPIFKKPSARPHLFMESRGFGSVLSADGPAVRTGQSQYWDYLNDDFLYPPVVRAPGAQMTVLDWLCYRRNVFSGMDATDGLDTQIAALYDFGEEYLLRKHVAYDTIAFPWRGQNQIVGVLHNTFQPPPVAYWPERDRDEYLDPTGDFCQRVWDFSQETRYAISTVDPVELIKDPDPDWLEAGPTVSGWFIRQHQHVTDGSEDDFKIRYDGVDWARWRPWHGWFWVHGDAESLGRCFLRAHADLRRALGFIAEDTLWLWFFDVGQQSADLPSDARDTEVAAEWCAGAWKLGHGMLILVGDAGNAKLYDLSHEGGTPTLASDLGAATSGDIFSTDDVTFRVYRLDDGTVKCHVLDVSGSEIEAFDTNLTGLDEEPIACHQSVAQQNGVQVALTAVEAGVRKVFLSDDGRNFS